MRISVITLFPDIVEAYLNCSILGRARQKNLFECQTVNLRDFGHGKRKQVDDRLFAGTHGMLLQVDVIWQAYLASLKWQCENITNQELKTEIADCISKLQTNLTDIEFINLASKLADLITQVQIKLFYLSPKGLTFNQATAEAFAQTEHLIFLCGHYEGIDSRVLKIMPWQEISLGNFVLTGGELAVLAMIDASLRLVDGVLPAKEAYSNESLYNGVLETEQFTQPANWHGLAVPEVLTNGNHKLQTAYKQQSSLEETYTKRPDLFNKIVWQTEDLTTFIQHLQAKLKQDTDNEV